MALLGRSGDRRALLRAFTAALLLASFVACASAQTTAVESVAPLSGGTVWCNWNNGYCTYPSVVAACTALTNGGGYSFQGVTPSCCGYAALGYRNCLFLSPTGQTVAAGTVYPYVTAVCPTPAVNPSVPYAYNATTGMCERPVQQQMCAVAPLTPLDPAVQPYEDGLIDLDHETQGARDGAACIVSAAIARHLHPRIQSAYRPSAYQAHIREVYDKWQLLVNNTDPGCADIKSSVRAEFNKHGPFAHQPALTSRHSSGRAIDISLSSYADADTIAAGCPVAGGGAMSRPVSNDRPHFESPR